jgi:hypothetical protein
VSVYVYRHWIALNIYIVPNRPVAGRWFFKQLPLLGNAQKLHASNNRTTGLCSPILSNGSVKTHTIGVLLETHTLNGRRDSVVGIANSYGLVDRGVGVRVQVGSRIFSSQNRPGRFWGPPNLLTNGYRGALYPRVNRPGRKVDHSLPTSPGVKKMWIYTFTSPYALME